MVTTQTALARQAANKIHVLQALFACATVFVVFCVAGRVAAGAAVVGALICLLPNVLFARQVLPSNGQYQPKAAVGRFFRGEAVKVLLTILMLVVILRHLPSAQVVPLLLAYMLTHMSFWFAPIVFKHQQV